MRRFAPFLLLLLAGSAAANPTKAELQDLLAATDQIARTVVQLRGLPIKRPIARGIMSRDEVTRRLILRIDEEYAADEIVAEEAALKRLGLLPADADYKKLIVDILTEQVAGFYDPQTKELYIADWTEVAAQRMILAHEICHALQDQSFDLVRFAKPLKENSDQELARQALVEGDGFALMIEFMLHEMGQKQDPWANEQLVNMVAGSSVTMAGMEKFSHAPLFLRETLLFPYTGGLRFVAATRKTRPWADVDGIFKRPPLSSEQILHPEKYRSGDKPAVIKPAALPSLKGWKRPYQNVLGELMFTLFFRQHGIEETRAQRAAAGWGGDRMLFFEPPGEKRAGARNLLVVQYSVWDEEMDAIEAFEAIGEAALSLEAAKGYEQKTGEMVTISGASGAKTVVERRGKRILFLAGVPAEKVSKLRGEAWSRWR